MIPALVALALAAGLTAAPGAPTVGSATEPAPTLVEPSSPPPPYVRRFPEHRTPTAAQTVATWVLTEAIVAGWSGLAARWPERTGWVMFGISPIYFANMQADQTVEGTTVFAAGTAGLGLCDALLIDGRGVSRSTRFWSNVAAWNLIGAAAEATAKLTRPERARPDEHAVSLRVGLADGRPRLLLSGRF